MILRIPTILITQSRSYAQKHFRQQPKKLRGAVIRQPERKNDEISPAKQKHIIKSSAEYQEDPEGFGDFESDFMEVDKSYNQFKKDSEQYREQVKHWIVREKYFKVKQPNFLTYAEKQHIKLLHTKDPEEWTAERLSESFPADPITIDKVIKAKWSASSTARIRKHDEHVMKNWSLLKNGKLTIDVHLKEHLEKFTNRNFEDLKNDQFEAAVAPPLPTPKRSEFSSIITSCKGYKEKQNLIESKETQTLETNTPQYLRPSDQENETFLISKIVNRKRMTFEEFKRKSQSALVEAPEIIPPVKFEETRKTTSENVRSSPVNSKNLEEQNAEVNKGNMRLENFKRQNPFKKHPQTSPLKSGDDEDVFTPQTISSPTLNPFSTQGDSILQEKFIKAVESNSQQTGNPFKNEILNLPPENPSGTSIIPRKMDDGPTEMIISKEDMKKYEMSTVKERIYIPIKLRRRGATYKVEDCYYDDDGEFLYRVPGMTGKSSNR